MRFFGDMSGVVRFPDYDPYRLLYRHTVGLTALARADVLEATGGYDLAFAHYEDWELWVNAWPMVRGPAGGCRRARVPPARRGRSSPTIAATTAWHGVRCAASTPALYARQDELAARSALGPAARALCRYFWGPRPIPAAVEATLHRLLWRPTRP